MESSETKFKNDKNMSKEEKEEKNYISERWTNGLTLRKKKLNAILSKKRGFEQFKKDGQKDYEIIKENLDLSYEIKNKKYDDLEQFLKEMKTYIQSENIELNKYALYCIRTQTLNNDNFNNKNILSELLYKKDFISDILNLMQKYIDDKQVIYEGLWILINVLYYEKENDELVLYLSNNNCIQLYIKILDKKDNTLRLNIYWLLSNLLNNNTVGLTSQVLFHLYMTTFYRLYLFKDLEDYSNTLTEMELCSLVNILSRLSEFINETFIYLGKRDISKFTNYNKNVDYDSIQENNNYLFYHSLLIFMKYIEVPILTSSCIFGLSKLTNFLQGDIFLKFFESGIPRKIVKEQIKISDEEFINFGVQIVGNFLNCCNEELLDPIFIQETLSYFIKLLQTYPNRQFLKRDIFWSTSNIVSCNNINFCDLFAKSGMLLLTLQSLVSDGDLVINEALFILLSFFDPQNIEIVINYHDLDYTKNLYLCLKNLHSRCKPGDGYPNVDIVERLLICIGYLFEDGEKFKGNFQNKFVKDFEKNGGFDLLENMLTEKSLNTNLTSIIENLLDFRKDNSK